MGHRRLWATCWAHTYTVGPPQTRRPSTRSTSYKIQTRLRPDCKQESVCHHAQIEYICHTQAYKY